MRNGKNLTKSSKNNDIIFFLNEEQAHEFLCTIRLTMSYYYKNKNKKKRRKKKGLTATNVQGLQNYKIPYIDCTRKQIQKNDTLKPTHALILPNKSSHSIFNLASCRQNRNMATTHSGQGTKINREMACDDETCSTSEYK